MKVNEKAQSYTIVWVYHNFKRSCDISNIGILL